LPVFWSGWSSRCSWLFRRSIWVWNGRLSGGLRPLHTSAVIFAFGGTALIATSFYVVQRTCRARWPFPASPGSSSGATSCSSCWRRPAICSALRKRKEYAEPEWYVDLWLTVVWVAYLAVFVGTIVKRKEPHIYVANWFYLSSSSPLRCCTWSTTVDAGQLLGKSYPRLGRRAGRADPVVVRP
jgi:cbb3-type cytochrome oxidase subunit 1